MKALILSLVIAFSSSFAHAACSKPNKSFGSKIGALTKSSVRKAAPVNSTIRLATKTTGVVK